MMPKADAARERTTCAGGPGCGATACNHGGSDDHAFRYDTWGNGGSVLSNDFTKNGTVFASKFFHAF